MARIEGVDLPRNKRIDIALTAIYGVGRAAAVRRELADELGISMTALRIRAHRLRAPVERCVTACLAQRGLS